LALGVGLRLGLVDFVNGLGFGLLLDEFLKGCGFHALEELAFSV
jgi:hypothetical protein